MSVLQLSFPCLSPRSTVRMACVLCLSLADEAAFDRRALANILPRVTVPDATVEHLGGGVRRVAVRWRNEGFLGTNGSDRAIETKAVRGTAQASIVLTAAAGKTLELAVGTAVTELPHLTGRASGHDAWGSVASAGGGSGRVGNPNEARLEWVVKGEGTVEVSVNWQRAGTTVTTLTTGEGGARL